MKEKSCGSNCGEIPVEHQGLLCLLLLVQIEIDNDNDEGDPLVVVRVANVGSRGSWRALAEPLKSKALAERSCL